MTDSVRAPNADLVTLEIKANGKTIPDTYLVQSVETHSAINRIPYATLTLSDGDMTEEDFPVSASDTFVPGTKIDVLAGYHAKNQAIFSGIVVGQRLRVDGTGGSSLEVLCKDAAVKLTTARTAAQYTDATDSDTITAILSAAGLGTSVTSTGASLPQQTRAHSTDWDFILSRAEVHGHFVLVSAGKVTVGPPKFEEPRYVAAYGESIMDVALEMSATDQLETVAAQAWDPKTQAVVSGTASEPTTNTQGNLTGRKLSAALGGIKADLIGPGVQSAEDLSIWASARLLKARMARFSGTVSMPGNAGLTAGTQIKLSGLGARFNGDAYMTGVRHIVRNGDWHSEGIFGLDPEWFTETYRDVSPVSAAGQRPGVSGLEIAKVKKTDEDPDGERRVQVSLPLRTDGDQGIWVRVASPYASNGIGIEFLPEIGDEVVLGFLGGDPDSPILLGALHSSANPAPIVPDEQNTLKTIVTKAKHKLTFDDDKKIITVETPGGHTLVLSDEDKSITLTDSNDNKIEMAEGGITLTSPGDITLSAEGSVKISGTAGVDVSSKADVKISGVNVSAEADIALTAKGSASAELSASGETTIKGAMVMIN